MEKTSGKKRQVASPAARHTPADAMMAIAIAAMKAQLQDTRWYRTAPAAARLVEPNIEITGIEYRNVVTTIGGGLGGSISESKPFLVGRVALGGIPAKLAMRVDFGIGGFIVLEGED